MKCEICPLGVDITTDKDTRKI